MSYTREELALLNRKELQKLCKQTGVRANRKTSELLNDLVEYFMKEENELKELENEMKIYETVDLNSTWTIEEPSGKEKKSENKENEDNQLLKDTLMKEVERRAEEKLSKIPRFVADNVIIPSISAQPVTPEVEKKRRSNGIKMDSIDKYLVKKQKRAAEQLNFNDKFKENKLPAKRMKMSNSVTMLQKPSENRRKSIKIDDEVTVNFIPHLRSTPNPLQRVSPRLSTLKERPKPLVNSSQTIVHPENQKVKTDGKRFTIGGLSSRKSVVRKSVGRKSVGRKSIGRKSVGGDRRRSTVSAESSPAFSQVLTPKTKTPPKFDIKASLKKPLSYKPHTGKLKEVYFSQQENTSLPRKPVNKGVRTTDRKTSVKEITKNMSTREKRRKEATDKRVKNRVVVLDKRRGIVC